MTNNLINRIITSIILVIMILISNLYEITFLIMYFIISICSLLELQFLLKNTIYKNQYKICILNGIIIYTTVSIILLYKISKIYIVMTIPLIFFSMILSILDDTKYAINNIFVNTGILIYIIIGFLSFINIRFLNVDEAYKITMGLLILIWIYDSTSYVIGTLLGKNIILKNISPKKTWEGIIGGLLISILLSYKINTIINSVFNQSDWIIITFIIIIFGTLGDFIESNIKRNINIKDTSYILPGHGGFLDRFDSLIISSPFILSYIIIKYTNFI